MEHLQEPMQQNLFYNTTGLKGDELTAAIQSNVNQDSNILELFKKLQQPLTPFDVQAVLASKGFSYPITSVRRSITCLTERGELEKLPEFKKGNYGRLNHKWCLKLAA